MPDVLTFLNDFTSIALATACWWLTHTYAAAGYPHGRPIAGIWATIGMVVLIIALARTVGADPSWLHVIMNVLLLSVAILLARRTQINLKTREHLASRASRFERMLRR